jgi:Tfp pilus assembly protein PilN
MRPVNLLPLEQRRGEHAPLRTGPLAYIVIGALVAVLVGVTALVLTGNQISDRKAEVANLEREDAVARARAERLAAYTQFRSLREQRVSTVTSLADSRFDWQRVMRELSLILPKDVWLVGLSATASPEVNIEGSSGSSEGGADLRSAVSGPALELSGCAAGQDAVAGFVTALKDIDGVTRVGVESSKLADQSSGAGVSRGGEANSSSPGADCRTRKFIAKFSIVVAFDAAPVPLGASSGEGVAPASATETAESTSTETSASSSESSEGG